MTDNTTIAQATIDLIIEGRDLDFQELGILGDLRASLGRATDFWVQWNFWLLRGSERLASALPVLRAVILVERELPEMTDFSNPAPLPAHLRVA